MPSKTSCKVVCARIEHRRHRTTNHRLREGAVAETARKAGGAAVYQLQSLSPGAVIWGTLWGAPWAPLGEYKGEVLDRDKQGHLSTASPKTLN